MNPFIRKILSMKRETIRKIIAENHMKLLSGNNGTILDIGCGMGEFLNLERGKTVGLEANINLAKKAAKTGARVYAGDARRLPFASGAFEGVHLSQVIEHFSPEDAYSIIKECHRVLKPNGLFLIASPLMNPDFYGDPTHIKPYHPNAIMMWVNPSEDVQNLQKSGRLFVAEYYSQGWNNPPFGFLGGHNVNIPGPRRLFRIAALAIREALFLAGIRTFPSEYSLLLRKIDD